MKTKYIALVLCCLPLLCAHAQDHQDQKRVCIADRFDHTYCAPTYKASIVRDGFGDVVCGIGQCREDALGNLQCAKAEKGAVKTDEIGNVLCQGGCEPASQKICVEPNADEVFSK